MNDDKILEMFFAPQRWQYAIEKGVIKDIRKDQLYQLTKPEMRLAILDAMRSGRYRISPPHTAKIPKDTPGEYRTVYVNEPIDRVVLSIANDLLFELMPEMIHPHCKSYQKGIGCGKIVQEVSRTICGISGETIGFKSDLSKYFDSVPIRYIDEVFDKVEAKWGKSALIDVIRGYYHSDIYFDEDNNLCEQYQSLKQGCAVAAFLANAILWHIDERMATEFNGYYIRYSDDMIFIGERYMDAMNCLNDELFLMDMRLNPKKVELLSAQRWFKFLGYSIKGRLISLSGSRLKKFQKEIESRTIGKPNRSLGGAVRSVNAFLYKGNGEHSWATQILPVVNVSKDIDTLNKFVMDCLRAVQTGKKKVGGLGYKPEMPDRCVDRGTGRNVSANRKKTTDKIPGYYTIGTMQKAMRTTKDVYNTLVAQL